jgi:hypothetical protein
MSRSRAAGAVLATGALVVAGLGVGSPASATTIGPGAAPTTAQLTTQATDLSSITPQQLDEALTQATALRYVARQRTDASGTRTTTIDLGHEVRFDVVQESSGARLGAGSDKYGAYVSFNATDQSAIINGAGWALGAGLCAISAGTFCVVAGAILAAATFAVSTNGVRCGSKSLRVYPFNSSRSPRCA